MQFFFEYVAFQLVRWTVLILPLKSAQRFGAFIGRLAFTILSRRRNIALDNLYHAFPEKTQEERIAIAKGAFQNYGIALIELLWFPNLNDAALRSLVKADNIEIIDQGYKRGKGMIMLSGHFGNWELIALGVAYLSKHPVSIIVQTQSNKRVNDVINRHRCLLGNSVIPLGMSVRETIKILNGGGIVAMAPDQSGPMEGVYVDFFGRRVASHQGPAALALRTRATMIIGFMIRQPDWTYEAILEEVPMADLICYSDDHVQVLTQRHTAILEKFIRQYPDHWLWMHRRWKHTWESVQKEKEDAKQTGV